MNFVQQIEFGNLVWEVGSECYIYQPNHKLLVLADLHLGKGSYFAQFGYPVPLYDAADTIHRLSLLIDEFKPYTVILLGDSFHNFDSLLTLPTCLLHQLNQITRQCETFIWIVGNHDSNLLGKKKLEGVFLSEFSLENIIFSHMPLSTHPYQIVGHYHPKIKVKIRGKIFKGKCYVKSEKLLIIPSFGSYTGGMYLSDSSMQRLIASHSMVSYYFVHKQGVFKI